MERLKNKVAVVTGASKGIGAAIAKHFAAEGAKVVVNYASSKEGAEKVVKTIIDNGGKAIAVQADEKEASPRILRKPQYFSHLMMQLGLLVSKYQFQAVCMVFKSPLQVKATDYTLWLLLWFGNVAQMQYT
jgi:enoyl-[acyl-carrier-protein] reductase (NADH)